MIEPQSIAKILGLGAGSVGHSALSTRFSLLNLTAPRKSNRQ
jgi:hypothetical protein